MIEEISDNSEVYTDDPDLETKLNTIINQVMFEIARMKKIHAIEKIEIPNTGLEYDLNELESFFQLDHIIYTDNNKNELEYDLFGNLVNFENEGKATIYYYKYPKRIKEDTIDTTYKFELSEDAMQVLPYGVAADLLKSDVSANYGQIYANRYNELLQRLDPRYSMSNIYFDTNGIEVI